MTTSTKLGGRSDRRAVLLLAGAGAGAAALAGCGSDEATDATSDSTGTGSGSGSSTATESGSATTDSGTGVATAEVPEGGGVILTDAKVVITQPSAGDFKAFSAVCTHQGCVVSGITSTIDCACHNSKFSLTDGSVVSGPATSPLPEMTATVDGDRVTVA